MKRLSIFAAVVLVLGLVGSARSNATEFIVNGDFGTPSEGGGYGELASTGGVPGWSTNGNAIEIDNPAVFGGGSAAYPGNGSDQSLEINAYYPEDVYQTVTGLIPGQTYTLSWAYGDRPGSGDEEMLVYFGSSVAGTSPGSDPGGTPVATDFDTQNGANPTLSWTFYSFNVTATSTSEVLSFVGLDYTGYQNNGGASYGNEIDDVSLDGPSSIATPEPSTWLLLLSGLGLLGLVLARRRQALPPSPAISL
jgi:hypothetical protein